MTGKEKCRLLRQIRNQVAEKNGLKPFEDTCTHTGECKGTCPKCDAEVKALSRALENKRARRKRVALAGVSLGMCATLAGCALDDAIDTIAMVKQIIRHEPTVEVSLTGDISEIELDGMIAMPVEEEILTGEVDEPDIEVETGEIDDSDFLEREA